MTVRERLEEKRKEVLRLALSGELKGLEGDALTEKIGAIATATALDQVGEKYDNPKHEDTRLAFHSRLHSELVVSRITRLIEAVNGLYPGRISKTEQVEAELAGASHDIEHVFIEGEGNVRKRKFGEGEERSATRLTALKRAANAALVKRDKPAIFDIDPEKDQKTIEVTIPSFELGKGVFQERLTKETPLTTRFLALADLADFGMDGPEKLLLSGRQLAIEDNSDIVEAIRKGNVSEPQKEEYRERLLRFMASQPNFAESRRDRFDDEIDGIEDPGIKAVVTDQFTYFKEENFRRAKFVLDSEITKIRAYTYDQMIAYIGIPAFIAKGES